MNRYLRLALVGALTGGALTLACWGGEILGPTQPESDAPAPKLLLPPPYTIPTPQNNGDGFSYQVTPIEVPPGLWQVSVKGFLNYSVNPVRLVCSPDVPPSALPGGLSQIGPAGFPPVPGYTFIGHDVNVAIGTAIFPIRTVALAPNDPTAEELLGAVQGPGVLWVERPAGFPGGCESPETGFQPDYFVSGVQTLTLEEFVPPGARVIIWSGGEELLTGPGIPGAEGGNTLQMLVQVVDSNNVPVLNVTVRLALDGLEQTGGHAHGGTMPAGSLSDTVVNTSVFGFALVTYTADFFSGSVEIRGVVPRATTAVETLTVAVTALEELQASATLNRIGVLPAHPQSHWGTAGMVMALASLADSLHARYGRPLEVNDIALPFGGKFDLNEAYGRAGRHSEHRDGRSADVRTHGPAPLSNAQRRFLQRTWERLGGDVHDETRTDEPHYHLRF